MMTNEQKQLLLQDLCTRLPYGVMINIKSPYENKFEIQKLNGYHIFESSYNIEDRGLKAYLRPMSSMTEEEKAEYNHLCYNCQEQDSVDYNITELDRTQLIYVIDWLNAHHFDYRGLIPMGIAIEAPEGMYNLKNKRL